MNSGSNLPSIDDNPCWGGPEPNRHDLEYLVRVLGTDPDNSTDGSSSPPNTISFSSPEEHSTFIQRVHQKLIIYQNANFMAIHKPADLRMDGPHRASVHKLLLYLFPSPSLQKMVTDEMAKSGENNSSAQEASAIKMKHQQLLKSIAPLSKHNFLKDDPFRNVHQLDYATSGVLLFGKTRKATGVASQAFEQRKTSKRYVAVVINPSSSTSNDPPFAPEYISKLPIMPPSSLDSWVDGSLEKRYRKKRQRDMDEREGKRGTFDGYMPPHSVFDKWRAALVREKKREAMQHNNSEQKMKAEGAERRRSKKKNAPIDLPALPTPKETLSSQDIDELLSLGTSWKKVKSHCDANNKNWTTIVETMTKEYNQSLAEYHGKKDLVQKSKGGSGHDGNETMHIATNLPPLFRIQNNGNSDSKEHENKDECSNQDPNTNSFYICASIGQPKDGFQMIVDPAVSNQAPISSPIPELRPSLTKCTVLWRGHTHTTDGRSIPVAKVLLQPLTGRRHQLRVHMAHVAGFPILGDAAYADDGSNERRKYCCRMCLHAKELSIPLIGDETKVFVAPDPFKTTKMNGCEDDTTLVIL